MGEQPFFVTAFLFVLVMTMALVRLGWNRGGWHWAAGWVCLWSAGGTAMLDGTVPGATAASAAFGTGFAALLYTGTRRFMERPVPREVIWLAVGVGTLRSLTAPFVGAAVLQTSAAVVISAGALAAAVEAMRTRRGGPRPLLLPAALPLAALAAGTYAYLTVTAGPAWMGIFVWLMAGVFLSGVQAVSLMGRVAARIEEERAVLAALLGSVPVGLALFDPDGRLRAANPAFRKLAPMPPEDDEAHIAGIADALHEELEPACADVALEPGPREGAGERELALRSGLHVSSEVRDVSDPRGEPLGRLWVLRDVTDERRLREHMDRARRMETIGSFAGGVAHDFNNQLTSVLGNAVLLRERFEGDAAAQEVLADLEQSAQRCARLTQDVLDFASRGRSLAEVVVLEEVLEDLVSAFEREHRELPQASLVVASDVPPVRADRKQLERVMTSLLDNACLAAGPGGHVEVRARRAVEPPGFVAIEVRDDGPGMEEAVRIRIFDPFFTTRPVGEGTGLGLAIVYGIVTAHGGEVLVDSDPGRGTRMVTTWPTVERDAVAG